MTVVIKITYLINAHKTNWKFDFPIHNNVNIFPWPLFCIIVTLLTKQSLCNDCNFRDFTHAHNYMFCHFTYFFLFFSFAHLEFFELIVFTCIQEIQANIQQLKKFQHQKIPTKCCTRIGMSFTICHHQCHSQSENTANAKRSQRFVQIYTKWHAIKHHKICVENKKKIWQQHQPNRRMKWTIFIFELMISTEWQMVLC